MPSVQKLIEGYFGREPSRTLNSKETPARGCALQCAMLSPAFRVREFQVQDSFPYGVEFSWLKDGEKVSNVVFEKGSHVPCAKMLTFYRSEPFDIEAFYTQDSDIPSTADKTVGKWTIGPLPKVKEEDKIKLKVKVVLNKNGVVAIESVNMIEETEVPVEQPKSEDVPMPEADATDQQETKEDEKKAEEQKGEVEAPKTKIKTTKTPLDFSANTCEVSDEKIQKLFETESEMALQARIQEETADAKNAVESYVYSLRNELYDKLSAFVNPDKKQEILSNLDTVEDWLYDEGEDEKKSVYVAKLEEIKKLGEPIRFRGAEAEKRPKSSESLKRICQEYLNAAQGGDSKYAHLTEEDLTKVVNECNQALAWLEEKEKLQASCAPFDDPVLTAGDIDKRGQTVGVFCRPILSKPPPKPKEEKEEPPKETGTKEDGEKMDTDDTPANAEGQEEHPDTDDTAMKDD